MHDERSEQPLPPILTGKQYDAPSVFTPENLLREARRQKGLESHPVPAICILEPPKRSPSFLLLDVSLPRCHAYQPSAAAPRPHPFRCGLTFYRAQRVKAAQEGWMGSGDALVWP